MPTPPFLKDAKQLLSTNGFSAGETWYHGTSSELWASIQKEGLKRSGDQAFNEATKKTMATLKHAFDESAEPVFLTPSKELAYYWAEQKAGVRKARLGGDDEPIVLAVQLSETDNAKVKPDVGAASLLLLKEGEHFLAHLARIYQDCDSGIPEIDLMKAERMEFLSTLGMAYFDGDIDPRNVSLVTEES